MTFTPFGGLIGSGISTVASPVGLAATAMGGLVFGLLVLTAVVILVGGRRKRVVTGTAGSDGYLAFLVARDGEADLFRHTLSHREAFLARLARDPVRSHVRLDRETFLRNLARRRPQAGLDDRMLWLLATAKANQAERFGVGLGELYGLVDPDDPLKDRITLQEHYHTRLLADVVAMFDLPVHARPPALLARTVVRLIVATPERWNLPRGNSPRGPRGGKAVPEWGSLEGTMAETSGSETISPKLQRVAQRQRVRDGVYRLAASPCSEEPYAVVPHVRICGSPGRATASGHPAIVERLSPAAYLRA